MRTTTETNARSESSNRFGRGLGIVLILIAIVILASAIVSGSLTTALLGGAVLMSGLMTRTDPRRNLTRRLAFAAVGVLLMGLYMLSR